MTNIVKTKFGDTEFGYIAVTFTDDGWFYATEVADKHKRRVTDWLYNSETQQYLAALAEILKVPKEHLLKTRRGRYGGTWMHPRLAVAFARWLDVRFGVWCDDQIFQILSGQHIHYDWKKSRHETSASFKVLVQVLQLTRQRLGKTCAPHHYSNEARLINWALTGELGKIDRDGLSSGDLDLLAKLENMDTVLIGCGASYDDRKKELVQFASEQRNRAPTSGLQSVVLPLRRVAPCCALGKQSIEPASIPDATDGQLTDG
ncbi:KilA-N domain-containing protein [Candidatus Nitrotoga arctica]|uniref:KilA-N domain-containing protein n=1 Tax=Candidatus Nitrotoga arctica TaxID=453162 RepID=A0ABM8YVQ4_9PROT|nr:KilA-N domain-containing protein [Candidatus Nitrotoga arctica]CAG9931543.1 KilA-N domain-containing protein [Candidatus Nitrotoga arctica]